MTSLAVSVIVPTYNRAKLLPNALDSILNQLQPGDEILVADDASTDDTAQVMKRYGPPVHFHAFEHGGAGVTRNRAIALAKNPLVAFLDSDDQWLPGKIQLQRQLMEQRPDVLFCFSNFAVRRTDGSVKHQQLNEWNNDKRGWNHILGPGQPYSRIAPLPPDIVDFQVHTGDLYLAELNGDHILTSTLMVRREAAGDALRFSEDLPVLENKECFARLSGKGPAAYLDTETTMQVRHAGPRLSAAHKLGWSSARLTVMERVWMKDEAFVAKHGAHLQKLVQAERLNRAHLHLGLGMSKEARADLRHVPTSPQTYRLLAMLPAPLLKGTVVLRRILLRKSA